MADVNAPLSFLSIVSVLDTSPTARHTRGRGCELGDIFEARRKTRARTPLQANAARANLPAAQTLRIPIENSNMRSVF